MLYEPLIKNNLHAIYTQKCRCSTVVCIPACHAGNPGSILGNGYFYFKHFFFGLKFIRCYLSFLLREIESTDLSFKAHVVLENLLFYHFVKWKRCRSPLHICRKHHQLLSQRKRCEWNILYGMGTLSNHPKKESRTL